MFNIISLSIHKTEKKNKKEKKREHPIKGCDRVTQDKRELCIHLLFADVLWVAGFNRYTHTEKKGEDVTLNDQRG